MPTENVAPQKLHRHEVQMVRMGTHFVVVTRTYDVALAEANKLGQAHLEALTVQLNRQAEAVRHG